MRVRNSKFQFSRTPRLGRYPAAQRVHQANPPRSAKIITPDVLTAVTSKRNQIRPHQTRHAWVVDATTSSVSRQATPALSPAEPMSSEDPGETIRGHHSRGSATALDPDAEFGGREAEEAGDEAATQARHPHVHPSCHLYPQLRELHAAYWFPTRIPILTPCGLIGTTRRAQKTPKRSEPLGTNFYIALPAYVVLRKISASLGINPPQS
jgi:hypothetical protein